MASHQAGNLKNPVNKTIGVSFVNDKQENRKLRFKNSGSGQGEGVVSTRVPTREPTRGPTRLQRDTSNFQHDMHSSENEQNEQNELNEQNKLKTINKTIVSRLTRPELKKLLKILIKKRSSSKWIIHRNFLTCY